jgi:glycerophosphoryl diester phosphodiesterase
VSLSFEIFSGIKKTLILAHRGSQKLNHYPENSIPAFQEAVALGASGIELDVRLSLDNVLFVMHDHNLHRLTGNNLLLERTRSDKLMQIGFLGSEKDIKIPTLREVFEKFGSTIYYNIEIKKKSGRYSELSANLLQLIDEFQLERKVWLSSFDFKFLLHWKKMNTNIPVALLFQYWNFLTSYHARHKVTNLLHPSARLIPRMKQIMSLGKPVCLWTVNDIQDLRVLKNMEIYGIITDDVPFARQVLLNE